MKFPHEDLEVWQLAMDFSERIYKTTDGFPPSEKFGITSQVQRASVSIALNIAEGKGRYHNKEYKQFLYNARGSLYETSTLILLAKRLGYLKDRDYHELNETSHKIMSKLSGLINYLKKD